MDKGQFFDFYYFRTRYLKEFNDFFDTIVNHFEKIVHGKELDGKEKGTLKQYCILREIAMLSSHVHHCDENMTSQLPIEKIHKCREIVDYFERKKEKYSQVKHHFFAGEASNVQLLISDFYLKLNQLLSLNSDLSPDKISKPRRHS